MTEAKFAARFVKALRAVAPDEEYSYDPGGFFLRSSSGGVTNLGNFFAEYQRCGLLSRRKYLKQMAAAVVHSAEHALPETFEEAAPNLLPRVRDRSFYGLTNLRCDLEGHSLPEELQRPYNDQLALELCLDMPDFIASVSGEKLQAWGVSWEVAYEAAEGNLRRMSQDAFEAPLSGLHISPWQDNHDASRFLLTDVIHRLSVKGDPVAMIPNRDLLLVAGAQDNAALAGMIKVAAEALEDPRSISGAAFVLRDGAWTLWRPPDEHPLQPHFDEALARDLGAAYTEQKELLERLHERDGVDLFVASFSGIAHDEEAGLVSYCTWTRDVVSLLPRTDLVCLVDLDDPDGMTMVRWEDLQAIAGARMKPMGLQPERWRVTDYLSDDQLAELQARAVKLAD